LVDFPWVVGIPEDYMAQYEHEAIYTKEEKVTNFKEKGEVILYKH
jgi:hypothetical protein